MVVEVTSTEPVDAAMSDELLATDAGKEPPPETWVWVAAFVSIPDDCETACPSVEITKDADDGGTCEVCTAFCELKLVCAVAVLAEEEPELPAAVGLVELVSATKVIPAVDWTGCADVLGMFEADVDGSWDVDCAFEETELAGSGVELAAELSAGCWVVGELLTLDPAFTELELISGDGELTGELWSDSWVLGELLALVSAPTVVRLFGVDDTDDGCEVGP